MADIKLLSYKDHLHLLDLAVTHYAMKYADSYVKKYRVL